MNYWPNRFIGSNQELGKWVLVLCIDATRVPILLYLHLKLVVDLCQQLFNRICDSHGHIMEGGTTGPTGTYARGMNSESGPLCFVLIV